MPISGFVFRESGDGKSGSSRRSGILPATLSLTDPEGWRSASYAKKIALELTGVSRDRGRPVPVRPQRERPLG